MVHGSSTKRFKRVKLAESRDRNAGTVQMSARSQEQINPFLFAPEEFAQKRRRHGGRLIAPTQFVPLDSARMKRGAAVKLRKKQLSRATADAERSAEIAKALSRAVRRERRTKSARQSRQGSDGMALGSGSGVSMQHIVNVSDVIFASPEAAQLLCGEDIEWVDEDDGSAERARRRRRNILSRRSHILSSANTAKFRSTLKAMK